MADTSEETLTISTLKWAGRILGAAGAFWALRGLVFLEGAAVASGLSGMMAFLVVEWMVQVANSLRVIAHGHREQSQDSRPSRRPSSRRSDAEQDEKGQRYRL